MRVYFLFATSVLALLGSRELADVKSRTKAWRLLFVSALFASALAGIGDILIVGSVHDLGENIGLANFHFVFVWGAGVPILLALGWKGE